MKITIPKKELKEALIAMSKIIVGKTSLAILGAIKISAEKSGVTVAGTDLEQSLIWIIKDATGRGSFIVNLKEVKEYLKAGGGASVQFEDLGSDRMSAIFHAGNIPVIKQFNCFPEKAWPQFSKNNNKRTQIPKQTLECIQKVIPSAAGKDDTRNTLKGIFIEPGSVVTTNGKQLLKLYCNTGIKDNMIIPASRFIKSAAFVKSDASISVEENDVVKYCNFFFCFGGLKKGESICIRSRQARPSTQTEA